MNGMTRKRNAENRGLPARWVHKHGGYYYLPLPGLRHLWDGKTWFLLGRTLPEAFKVWAERTGAPERITTIGSLLDRYSLQVIPTKAPKTQTGNRLAVCNLRPVFGGMALADLEPQHIYQYVDRRGAPTQAHREIEVLSHAFTKAVSWGLMKAHPFRKEVRLENKKPRTRYIEDWEVIEALALPSVRKRGSVGCIQAYTRLKLLTGLRRGDLLRLRVCDCRPEGIAVTTSKTGKPVVYEWSLELRAAVDGALAARPVDISPWLFCNRRGKAYIDEATGEAHGWSSMWQRYMTRVLKETAVKERFTEHDLRAKVASDADSLERARQLLTHADSKITQRVYRRKPERIKPVR
jgi:integrase